MGIWFDILKKSADGDGAGARALLSRELRLLLSTPSYGNAAFKYQGPVPKAVAVFVSKVPIWERPLASSRADDFADYIIEDVVAVVGRTLQLVEVCTSGKPKTLDEIVESLTWPVGLKLGFEWKRGRVADELRSMLSLAIPLPAYVNDLLGTDGKPGFDFNEIAYATAPRRLTQSWQDFKRKEKLGARFVCVPESEDDTSAAAEAFDYGSTTNSRLLEKVEMEARKAISADLHRIGAILSTEITALMESLHAERPTGGFRPIAWHNVFWEVVSEHEALRLVLDQRRPLCDDDQVLADYITENYIDVIGTSRPTILRRRTKLYGVCEELIHSRIRENLNST